MRTLSEMSEPHVSIVVPVYNGEQYLHRCIKSALAQNYNSFEVLVIDDGSTDGTASILEFYAKNFKVRTFYQQHSGVAIARNTGVQMAYGELIAFLDSDDWITPDYIDSLVRLVMLHNSDVSICGMKKVFSDDCSSSHKGKWEPLSFSSVNALEEMLYQNRFDTGLVGKLIPKSLLLQHPCPKGRLYEDFFVMYRILLKCDNVSYCGKNNYFYFQHKRSVMHQPYTEESFDQWIAAEEVTSFIRKEKPEILPAAISKQFSVASAMLAKSHILGLNEEERKTFWKFICKNRWCILLNSKTRTKNRVAALCSFGGEHFFAFLYWRFMG